MTLPLLVVYSHLRWCGTYGRPQQLLSRLVRRWRVVFVEEPRPAAGLPRLEESDPVPGLTVLVPRTPLPAAGFTDDQLPLIAPLLAARLARERPADDRAVALLYTPLALPLLAALPARGIVYDSIDDLAAHSGAPPALRAREAALLDRAALVLAAGPSRYDTLRRRHANVHCVPSAVDAAHFDPERLDPDCAEAQAARALQDPLARPRLGWFGVIDERLDLALVAALADAHPEWQLAMAGPIARLDAAALPQRPNIRWLGAQPYARLPHLLAGWDVALLPFTPQTAARGLNPTQTLEYLAGEKPVVATPLPDIVLLYGSVVRTARGPAAFVAACEEALAASAAARCRRQLDALATVATHSWDRTADGVHRLIEAALCRPPPTAPRIATAAAGD